MKKKLGEDEVFFGAIKVLACDDTNKLPRYMGLSFVGKNVTGLKRGRAMGAKSQVDKIFKGLATTAECEQVAQVTPTFMGQQLKKAGGSSPLFYDFGSDKIYLKDLH